MISHPDGELADFEGPRGLRLNLRHWKNPGARRTVLGIHGYSEHSGCYAHFADFLLAQKMEVIWVDLPGHGLSDGPRSDISRFEDYLETIERFAATAELRSCPKPFQLFGHSLGGLVAVRFIQNSSKANLIQRMTLSSPLFGLANYPAAFLPALRAVARMLPNFSWANDSELGTGILTHDPEMTARRSKDPLIKSRVTMHFVREFLRAREEAFEEVRKIKIPTALFQAGDDRVTHRSEAERFYSLLECQKQKTIYDGLFHEILNEVERARVMNEMLKWMDAQ